PLTSAVYSLSLHDALPILVCGPAHGVPVVEAPVDPLAADPARVGACAQALGLGAVGAVVSASLLGHVHLPRMRRAPAVPGPSDSTSQSITMVRDNCPVGKSNRRTLHLGSDGQVSRGSRKRANTSYRPPRSLSHSVSFRSPMPTISPP